MGVCFSVLSNCLQFNSKVGDDIAECKWNLSIRVICLSYFTFHLNIVFSIPKWLVVCCLQLSSKQPKYSFRLSFGWHYRCKKNSELPLFPLTGKRNEKLEGVRTLINHRINHWLMRLIRVRTSSEKFWLHRSCRNYFNNRIGLSSLLSWYYLQQTVVDDTSLSPYCYVISLAE